MKVEAARALSARRSPVVVEPVPRGGAGGLPRLARRLYECGQRRSSYLPASVYGEPAWNVLLDLYASEAEGRVISMTSASIASGAPQTTGLRVLRTLERNGLVARARANEDKRRCDLRLTLAGRDVVERTLAVLTPILAE